MSESSACPLCKLCTVEVQLVMQLLNRQSLLHFARCSKVLLNAAPSRWVWQYQRPFYIKLWKEPWQMWIRPPTNMKRWWRFYYGQRSVCLGRGPAICHPRIIIQGAAPELGKLPDDILAAAHTVSIKIKKGYNDVVIAQSAKALTKCISIQTFGWQALRFGHRVAVVRLIVALQHELATMQRSTSTITKVIARDVCWAPPQISMGNLLESSSKLSCLKISTVIPSTRSLSADSNVCRDVAAIASRLAFLDVTGIRFRVTDMDLLAAAVSASDTISTLRVGDTGTSDQGAVAFAAAFGQCKTLHTVDLSNNLIGDEGGIALAHAVQRSSTLTSLDLNNNLMGATVMDMFAVALTVNRSLRSLCLAVVHTTMDMDASIRFAGVLATQNTTLQRITLSPQDKAGVGENANIISEFKRLLLKREIEIVCETI